MKNAMFIVMMKRRYFTLMLNNIFGLIYVLRKYFLDKWNFIWASTLYSYSPVSQLESDSDSESESDRWLASAT